MLRKHWRHGLLLGAGVVLGVLYSRMSFAPVMGGDTQPTEISVQNGNEPKPATEATKKANADFAKTLPFADKRNFELAKRGKIADLPDGGVVKNAKGQIVWDPQYGFIKLDQDSPDTVNPSLWRVSQVMSINGLFKVTDQIYQVRGHDLSNITFIEGKNGVTIVDPLICEETAKASLDLYYQHRPKKPVVAVIYTHSHVDHYGGVKGVTSEADVMAGKCRIIAPEHFTEEAVSENVMAGNAMSRRAQLHVRPAPSQGSPRAGFFRPWPYDIDRRDHAHRACRVREEDRRKANHRRLELRILDDARQRKRRRRCTSSFPNTRAFAQRRTLATRCTTSTPHVAPRRVTRRSGRGISPKPSTCGATRPKFCLRRTTGRPGATRRSSITSRNTVTPSSTSTTRCCVSPIMATP